MSEENPGLGNRRDKVSVLVCHSLAKPMISHLQDGGDNAFFVPLL